MFRVRAITTCILAACGLLADQHREETREGTSVAIPFVGCPSDGQTGPRPAPDGKARVVEAGIELAEQLAYYSSAEGFGVLGPRGWHCFGTYGSGGEHLYLSRDAIDTREIFGSWPGLRGPAIELDYRYGGTSGRFDVADVIARVFPAYKGFALSVMKELAPADRFTFAPFPGDKLTYKSKSIAEYRTAARAEGLGTLSAVKSNGTPIDGVAMLVGKTPDLIQLAVRLPPGMNSLTPAIIHQVEREALRHQP